ncbi:predicted Zn-dependent peptidase [Chthonomonas calidirosea]|uniref:Predicted Zn-dependent peptidases n=2 Tax=Chthonomonas TaxID=1077265 RepID=S0EZU0_CHTCT|nr:Predicted Zn-dependent peptidases [Chthonomonas calidirosea T49]CEK16856.1 predicted Zn-dependent peptidase [Chthonomonas calidirosea]
MKPRVMSVLLCSMLSLLTWQSCKAESGPLFLTHLSNGLTVVVKERHSVPLVAIDLWMRAGAREEHRDEDGTAHFLEHMLFRGTTERPGEEADISAERFGASLDAETGPDALHIYTTVEAVHFAPVLQIIGDVAQHALLPDSAMEKERGVILDELARRDADPINRLITLLYAHTYSDSAPYHRSPGGTPEGIALRARDTLMAFYQRCCRPDRSALVLVGDVTPKQVLPEVVQVFGGWQAVGTTTPQPIVNQEPQWPETSLLTVKGDAAQWIAAVALRAPRAANKTMVAAGFVLADLLQSAFADHDSEADLQVHFSPRRDPSLYVITFRAESQEQLRRRGQELLHLLQQLQLSVPQDLFLEARQRAIGRLDYQTETDEGYATAIGEALTTGGDLPDQLRERLQNLTSQDAELFLSRYLRTQDAFTVVMEPALTSKVSGESLRP